MKRSTIFILLLAISYRAPLKACVDFFTYGEYLRYTIFDPHVFGFRDYSPFFYSSHYFAEAPPATEDNARFSQATSGELLNTSLWRARCENVPSLSSVYEAVYSDGNEFRYPGASTNAFVQYLWNAHDTDALTYLRFAKNTSFLADNVVDPWERNENNYRPQRDLEVDGAIRRAGQSKDDDIRMRYAFQAIRISFYNNKKDRLQKIYEEFFARHEKKNIIDYWAMYYYTVSLEPSALQSYYAAQVFANAPDKRYGVGDCFDRSVPVTDVLKLAKNSRERSAIWTMAAMRDHGRCLEKMKMIRPGEALDFLLLREVNKLEDWIYTPYYTNFEPAVSNEKAAEIYRDEYKRGKRIENDREYAAQLLAFVDSHMEDGKNKALWKSSRAYLLFMTGNDLTALEQITEIQKSFPKDKQLLEQMDLVKALCLVHIQPSGQATIPGECKPVLMNRSKIPDHKFIFAVAKELEYKGNTCDAAALLSLVNTDESDYEHRVNWRRHNGPYYWYSYVYDNYFSYIDAAYTPAQVDSTVHELERGIRQPDKFSQWEFSWIKNDVPRLYDLLGTMYMRENRLQAALSSFEKVNDTLWTSQKSVFREYLDANPFYADFYSEHKHTVGDTIRYTKESIARTLISYLQKAEDETNADRDYYYFLVANCYFNMTHYGNSWMMKRYRWESNMAGAAYIDGKDFFSCDLAKSYYLKARSVSKTKKFAALCLRMAGRCEKYRLYYVMAKKDYYDDVPAEKVFKANKYYRELRKMYPYYYDDLIGNCYSFGEYFKKRR